MLASFPSAMLFSESISPSNAWWMGEKYDGIRICWHADRNELYLIWMFLLFCFDSNKYTRSGIELGLPDPLLDNLAELNSYFDGEIWYACWSFILLISIRFGRGHFGEAQTLLSPTNEEINWSSLRWGVYSGSLIAMLIFFRCVMFDDPNWDTRNVKFEKRYENILGAIPEDHPFVVSNNNTAWKSELSLNVHRKLLRGWYAKAKNCLLQYQST